MRALLSMLSFRFSAAAVRLATHPRAALAPPLRRHAPAAVTSRRECGGGSASRCALPPLRPARLVGARWLAVGAGEGVRPRHACGALRWAVPARAYSTGMVSELESEEEDEAGSSGMEDAAEDEVVHATELYEDMATAANEFREERGEELDSDESSDLDLEMLERFHTIERMKQKFKEDEEESSEPEEEEGPELPSYESDWENLESPLEVHKTIPDMAAALEHDRKVETMLTDNIGDLTDGEGGYDGEKEFAEEYIREDSTTASPNVYFEHLADVPGAITELNPLPDPHGRDLIFGRQRLEVHKEYEEGLTLIAHEDAYQEEKLDFVHRIEATPVIEEFGGDEGAGESEQHRGLIEPMVPEMKRDEHGMARGHGGRKSSKAHALLREVAPGEEPSLRVNGKLVPHYFCDYYHREVLIRPLVITDTLGRFAIEVETQGGGKTGQSGAASLAIARAITSFDPQYRVVLRNSDALRRDSRKVERKKPGRTKARKGFQWVKR